MVNLLLSQEHHNPSTRVAYSYDCIKNWSNYWNATSTQQLHGNTAGHTEYLAYDCVK